MRKILLASAGVIFSAGTVYAACIPTPSCSSLGYESSSSCEGGIKCPFGNAWNCTLANKVIQLENKVTTIINNQGKDDDSSGNLPSSGVSCSACSAGNFVCGNSCVPVSGAISSDGYIRTDCSKYVVSKTNNTCTAYNLFQPQTTVTYQAFEPGRIVSEAQQYVNIMQHAGVPNGSIQVPVSLISYIIESGTDYVVKTVRIAGGRVYQDTYTIPKSRVNLTPSSTSIGSMFFAKIEPETFN